LVSIRFIVIRPLTRLQNVFYDVRVICSAAQIGTFSNSNGAIHSISYKYNLFI